MSKIYVVYTINLQGKVMYVGKTCNFGVRKSNHLTQRGKWRSSAIPSDIDLEEVTFNVVAKFEDEKEALTLEGELILQYDTIKNGWNKKLSGLVSSDMKKYQSEWYQEHKEEHNYRSKLYHRQHKEEYNKNSKKYYQEHKAERNAYKRAYRARKKALCNL